MMRGSTDQHPTWCPLDHGGISSEGSFGRALCILAEDGGWEGEPLVVMVIRDETDSYVDPEVHTYLRIDEQISVAYYGFYSEDIARMVSVLLHAVDAMAESERSGTSSEQQASASVWDHAAMLEPRSGFSYAAEGASFVVEAWGPCRDSRRAWARIVSLCSSLRGRTRLSRVERLRGP